MMRRVLKKSLLLLALLGVVFGMAGTMPVAAAPVGHAQSAMLTQQSGGCMGCRSMQPNGGAPHHGSMGGTSCMGATGCSMPVVPSALVTVIPAQSDIQPVGPDRTGGRMPGGPDTRPPIVHA